MLHWLRMEPPNSGVLSAAMRSDGVTGAGNKVSPIAARNVVLGGHKWEAWH
jgi:hypothetical protein